MATATSRSGSISVVTTEQGLPTALTVEPDELRRDPAELAADILRLCRRAADRAGLERRAELSAAGLSSEALALTGLPRPEEVAARELAEEQEYEQEPQSWMRSV
ncbi:MAG TPA: hypothetical protein VK083_08835 [Nocardia sp.]|uniref:hypothetical protein n=1 Tax=Nocardia TaxID=1817 RepID=UPI002458E402|nr:MULTISPECIES: hypothetical protein [Nocardia]HLS76878.1 hypothetical protein [Nocardia sp.]